MTSAYIAGQLVEVLPYGTKQWRNAVVQEPAPYSASKHGFITDGARIVYDPLPTDGASIGGWYPSNAIRARAALAKGTNKGE